MADSSALSTHLSTRAQNIQVGGGWARNEAISFIYGFPAPECLPNIAIGDATIRALKKHGEWALQYGGDPGLADVLINKLARDQKIKCTRANLMITAGSSQALAYICELMLDPGDVVLSEAPTFLGTARMMRNLGVEIESVPLDDDGVRVDALEATLMRLHTAGQKPKLFYVIPTFQNPTGVTTILERRKRIVELARKYDFAILEDDAYHDLRFSGERLPPLYVLDDGERTFYTGTFSKILAPGLRLGWMVAHPDLIGRISALKTEGGASPYALHTALEFCGADGVGLDTNIARLKIIYSQRCDIMLDALTEFMPLGVHWTIPKGGFFVWLTLPEKIDASEMIASVRERGVDYLPGNACFFDGSGKNTIRLAFSYASADKLTEGIRIIAEEVRARC